MDFNRLPDNALRPNGNAVDVFADTCSYSDRFPVCIACNFDAGGQGFAGNDKRRYVCDNLKLVACGDDAAVET